LASVSVSLTVSYQSETDFNWAIVTPVYHSPLPSVVVDTNIFPAVVTGLLCSARACPLA
jgi:hypothetical protein